MFVLRETANVRSPIAALDVLTTRAGARAFRDIGEYTTYTVRHESDGSSIGISYPSGIPFAAPVDMTLRPRGTTVTFAGTGPFGSRIEGRWHVARDGTVTLDQTVSGTAARLPWARLAIRRKVLRALEDLKRAAG